MGNCPEILKNLTQNFEVLLVSILLMALPVAVAFYFGKYIFPQRSRRKRTAEEEKDRMKKIQRNILMGDPHP